MQVVSGTALNSRLHLQSIGGAMRAWSTYQRAAMAPTPRPHLRRVLFLSAGCSSPSSAATMALLRHLRALSQY